MSSPSRNIINQARKENLFKQFLHANDTDEIAKALDVNPELVEKWKQGTNPPTREQVIKMAVAFKIELEQVDDILRYYGYSLITKREMSGFSVKNTTVSDLSKYVHVIDLNTELITTPKRDDSFAVKQFDESITRLQDSVKQLSERVKDIDNDSLSRGDFSAIIDDLKREANTIRSSGEEITAPVRFPKREQMEVLLLPASYVERLEEYRADENTWSMWFGVFIGSIIGVFINVATGGNFSSPTVIVLIFLVIMTLLSFNFRKEAKIRGDKLRKGLIDGE